MRAMTWELKSIIKASRILAIKLQHDFIHFDHLFYAIYCNECLVHTYLQSLDLGEWEKSLAERYSTKKAPGDVDLLPLTADAENIIKLAETFAQKVKQKEINTIHLLLALISYNNYVSESLKKKGIIFEDISTHAFKGIIVKVHPHIQLRRLKNYSFFEKIFLSKSSIEKKINDLYIEANNLFEYEEFDLCIRICEIGMSLHRHVAFRVLTAYAYMGNRKWKEASDFLIKLINDFPDDYNYSVSLTYVYDETGQYLKAAEILDHLLLNHSDDATVLNNKGFNLCYLGKYDEAVSFYERAIQTDPSFAYAYNNLGFAKFKLGDINEAHKLIDKSLQLDSGNSYAYKNKGILFKEVNNTIAALDYFNLALKFGYTKKYGDEVVNLIKQIS